MFALKYKMVAGDDLPSLALRFGVSETELRLQNERQEQERHGPWRPGTEIDIPFERNPEEGMVLYEYDYAQFGGTLEEIVVLQHEANKRRYPLWNNDAVKAHELWNCWYNREFNAWQRKHGFTRTTLGRRANGEKSPPIFLPSRAVRTVRIARDVSASSVTAATAASPVVNVVYVPTELEARVRELIAKIVATTALLKDDHRRRDEVCQQTASFLGYARALHGLVALKQHQLHRDGGGRSPFENEINSLEQASKAFLEALKTKIDQRDPVSAMGAMLKDTVTRHTNEALGYFQDRTLVALLNELVEKELPVQPDIVPR